MGYYSKSMIIMETRVRDQARVRAKGQKVKIKLEIDGLARRIQKKLAILLSRLASQRRSVVEPEAKFA
jgi:hypothetical protein